MEAPHHTLHQPALLRLASALVGCTEIEAVALSAVRALETDPGTTWVLLRRDGDGYAACTARPLSHKNLWELAARACARGVQLNASQVADAIIPFADEPLWVARRDYDGQPELVLGAWVDPGSRVPSRDELNTAIEFIAAATVAATEVARLRRQSNTDPLTGVLNRRGITRALAAEEERAARHQHPVAVLLADVDDFKTINDRYGHAVGDRALEALARAMVRTLRTSDLVGRIGGDEFLVILPHCTEAEARQVAERLAEEIAAVSLSAPDGTQIQVGATIGAAGSDVARSNLVDLADQCMLRGKRNNSRTREAGRPVLALAL